MEWLLVLVLGVLLGFFIDQILVGIAIVVGLMLTYQAARIFFNNRRPKS